MRTTRPAGSRRFTRALLAVLLALGALIGFGLAQGPGAVAGALAGALAGLALDRRAEARYRRRRQLLAQPFPERWRELLLERCDHYDRLPDDLRRRFEGDLRLFLAERRISGVGLETDEELRLLTAASAVTLSLGWPDYEWEQVTEVLLYPQDFDRDYSTDDAELAGQAHPWGTVILSAPALRQSFADPDDGFHVGFHEFAHLLDVDQARIGGIPPGLRGPREREWLELREREMERLRKGKSVLDPYGAEDPVEFMAVAVETFFEAALEMRQRHRELYALLRDYFGQDPAAWDDERGLVL